MRLIRCDYPGCGWEVEDNWRTHFTACWVVTEECAEATGVLFQYVSFDVCPGHETTEHVSAAGWAVAARIAKEGRE